jgi:hypothetical protein
MVSVAGTVDGVDFKIGDRLISILDNASTSTYANNWFKDDGTDRSIKEQVEASTEKTTFADNDWFNILDSAASFVLKKVSWATIKAAIQSLLKFENITGARQVLAAANGTINLDLNTHSKWRVTCTGNVTYNFQNIPTSNDVKGPIIVERSGAFTQSWSQTINWKANSEDYDGTKINETVLEIESDVIWAFNTIIGDA